MQHKGEIVEHAVRQSGYSITKLAAKLGKSRRWMYHVFQNPNLTIELVLDIGKIIHHDFTNEIKELKKYSSNGFINEIIKEPEQNYFHQQKEIEYWKNKYVELLEKHNALLTSLGTKKPPVTRKNKD